MIPDSARKTAYGLLARLYLEEIDRDMLKYLRRVPGLADYVPASNADTDAWLKDVKVDCQWLFGMNVYPYESVYVGDEVMLNTAATQRVVAFYRECGFEPASDLRFGAPDHIGVEMTLMAKLIEADRPARQSQLLYQHLSTWGPIFARTAARVTEQPFYQALAELTIELLLSDLENVSLPSPMPETETISLQSMNANSGSGGDDTAAELNLNTVVDRLLTPGQVGVFLSRGDMLRLAHKLDLPASILKRSLMLKNLFRAAGQYNLVPELLTTLAEVLEAADVRYAEWATAYPAWSHQASAWRARVEAGLSLLDKLRNSETNLT